MKRRTKKFNQTLGCYSPSFFMMEADINSSMSNLDITAISNYEQSVFFHEYIHFMQDFMTTSGLNNIYCINESFKEIATNFAIQNPFLVPVIWDGNHNNIRLINAINHIVSGGDDDYDCLNIISISKIAHNDNDLIAANHPPINRIYLQTNNGSLLFGEREISESMAFLLEKLCTRDYAPSPEYPYCAAEKVAKFICHNGFEQDLINILALCDISLMTLNPGEYFYDCITQISNGTLSLSKIEDLYDDFYNRMGKDNNNQIITTLQYFEERSNHAKKELKSYIDIPQINATLYPWIDLVFGTGVSIRKHDRYFFINLARHGYFIQNPIFAKFLNTVGSPIIKNGRGEFGRFPSNPDYGDVFQYLAAVEPVYEIFYGNFICTMIDFCEQSKENSKIKVNQYCIGSPWRRCNDADLCPVAMIMKHRKLAINEPTLRP